ncbi:hypothetical protein [Actinomadura algeriensis]|uniref:Uncharacterized protein n=1 Tax=Actinomadura algeriensis TaxID=1679523 RepID=A0ABR9JIM4_9ACTN|nr:hypothetical protein [Actinomadura algeriensis]MBE1530396.1 hypothetical protein [Actinomadura algeriensis]
MRSVARIRFSVAAVNGAPRASWRRTMPANIACRWATDNSASTICPRYGARYLWTWQA